MPNWSYGSQRRADNAGWNYGSHVFISGPVIVGFTGRFAPGEQIDITTALLGEINSIVVSHPVLSGSFNLNIDDVSSADHVLATLPELIDAFAWGQSDLIITVSDGTDSAQLTGQTLLAQNGWLYFSLSAVPDNGISDSFVKLAQNSPIPGTDNPRFPGYVPAVGQQIQYTVDPALSVDDQSIVFVDPAQTVTGRYRIHYVDGSTAHYIEAPFTIGEPDSSLDAFSFAVINEALINTQQLSEVITPAGANQELAISITGGECSINGNAFTSSNGSWFPGNSIQLRVNSAATYPGSADVVLTIGDVSATWSIVNRSVAPDTEAPVITLVGGSTIEHVINTPFVDSGYSATDNVDGDITSRVNVVGVVDVTAVGANALTYSVTDDAGNAVSVTRTVNVIALPTLLEPIDARIYVEPAYDDGEPHVLYQGNTNLVVIADIEGSYSESAVSVASATMALRRNDAVVFGPVAMTLNGDKYIAAVPHSFVSAVSEVLTLFIDIDSASGAQGQWSIPLVVADRVH